jgi:hypothetical protein
MFFVGLFPVSAQPEDGTEIMVDIFDHISVVPVMGTLLGIMSLYTTDPIQEIDQRLTAVEAMLNAFAARLTTLEGRVEQLQVEAVRNANADRVRALQLAHAAIAELNHELLTRPTDPAQLSILEFRARQQAGLLRDSAGSDVWMFSDIKQGQLRTKFHVSPAFELYALAIHTWVDAIQLKQSVAHAGPQATVAAHGADLKAHALFLRLSPGFRIPAYPGDPAPPPKTVLDRLHSSVFCMLDAYDTYADAAGRCTFVEMCVDNIEDRLLETGSLNMNVGASGTLCTFDPEQQFFFNAEDRLRDEHGQAVMIALADMLDRFALTGDPSKPASFPGQFANNVHTPIFSVSLDRPLGSAVEAVSGAEVQILRCSLGGRCRVGPEEQGATWIVDFDADNIRHTASGLCLDIKLDPGASGGAAGNSLVLWSCGNVPTQRWQVRWLDSSNSQFRLVADGELCATVEPLAQSSNPHLARVLDIGVPRPVKLAACDNSDLQIFSYRDSTPVAGPN